MKRYGLLVVLAACLLAFVSCAQTQVQNQYQAYVTVDKEFTTLTEQYEVWYQAADAETKARWKEKIDPLILEADRLLDVYQTVLLAGGDPTNQIVALREIKTAILVELAAKLEKK